MFLPIYVIFLSFCITQQHLFFKNVSVNLNAIERKIIELILNDHALTAEKHQLKLIKQKELLKDI